MIQDGTIDWAMGETLAIGSLLTDGVSVRLAGQDSRRGTFGQRHMVIIDRKTGWAYKPLKRCYEKGAKLYVYDSPLSEFAAMGFEYGYSVARPEALVIWEAQFGDFVNGAQTIIDEFIAPPASRSGVSSLAWCCCFPTATKAKAPTTRQRASSASCSSARKTT